MSFLMERDKSIITSTRKQTCETSQEHTEKTRYTLGCDNIIGGLGVKTHTEE